VFSQLATALPAWRASPTIIAANISQIREKAGVMKAVGIQAALIDSTKRGNSNLELEAGGGIEQDL
jgi:hypothetical protein